MLQFYLTELIMGVKPSVFNSNTFYSFQWLLLISFYTDVKIASTWKDSLRILFHLMAQGNDAVT